MSFNFQLFDLDPQGEEDEGANIDLDAQRQGKCAVIKTSTRQVEIQKEKRQNVFRMSNFLDVFFTGHWSR